MNNEIKKRGPVYFAMANSTEIIVAPHACGFVLEKVNCIFRYQYYEVPKGEKPGPVSYHLHVLIHIRVILTFKQL